jgi:hypothetical protein
MSSKFISIVALTQMVLATAGVLLITATNKFFEPWKPRPELCALMYDHRVLWMLSPIIWVIIAIAFERLASRPEWGWIVAIVGLALIGWYAFTAVGAGTVPFYNH